MEQRLDRALQALARRLEKLRADLDLTIMLISHDLGMVAHLAGEGVVMSEGSVVEEGLMDQLMTRPEHAYTKQLVDVFR